MSGALYTAHGTGLIATLRRGGDVTTAHFAGGTTPEAVTDLVAYCDAEGWRVVSICTPATVLRDLRGTRAYRSGGTDAHPRTNDGHDVATPERRLLSHRPELLA